MQFVRFVETFNIGNIDSLELGFLDLDLNWGLGLGMGISEGRNFFEILGGRLLCKAAPDDGMEP